MDTEKLNLFSEAKEIFIASNPGSDAFEKFEGSECPVTAIEELIAINCHCLSPQDAVNFFISRYSLQDDENATLSTALNEILEFATDPESISYQSFLSKLATLHLKCYSYLYEGIHEYPALPETSIEGAALIDLVSGYDFSNFLNKISDKAAYYAIDKSKFATEVITQKANILNLSNVLAINKDVMELCREDISIDCIEIIRAKNIFTYVPRYLNVFQKHLSWLCDGGKFIFAEQSSERDANSTFLNNLVLTTFFELVSSGWSVNYHFGSKDNPMALNTISFIKNRQTDQFTHFMKLQSFITEVKSIYGL